MSDPRRPDPVDDTPPRRPALPERLARRLGVTVFVASTLLAVMVSVGLVTRLDADHVATAGALNLQDARALTRSLDADLAMHGREMLVRARWLGELEPSGRVRAMRSLMNGMTEMPEHAWAGVTDSTGKVVVSMGGILEGVDVAHRDWWKPANHGIYFGDVHEAKLLAMILPPRPNGEPWRFVDLAVPVRDVSGSLVGVLASHLSWAWLNGKVRQFGEPAAAHGAQVYLVGPDGHQRYGETGAFGDELPLAALRGERSSIEGSHAVRWPDGQVYVTSWTRSVGEAPFSGFGWTTVVRSPVEGPNGPFPRHRVQVWSGAALAVFVLTLLATLLQRHLLGLHREARQQAEMRAQAQRSREALEQGRAALERLFHASATASLLVRPGGAIVMASDQAEALFGWNVAQLKQMSLCELFPEADRKTYRERLAAFFEAPVERRIGAGNWSHGLHACGRKIPIETALSMIELDGERFALWAAVDVTEKVRADERVREAHASTEDALVRSRLMTEAARLGTWFWEPGSGRLTIDEPYAAMLGETVESFGSQVDAFSHRLHPDDVALLWTLVERHLQGESENLDSNFRVRHADGHWVRISSHGRVVTRDAEGRPVALAGVHRDVTDEWAQRQATIEAKERLESVTRGAQIATWRWFPKASRIEVNDRWFEQFGLRRGDMPETFDSWLSIVHPDDWKRVRTVIDAHLRGAAEELHFEARIRHPEAGWVWIRTQGRAIERDADGQAVLVAGIDIDVTAAHRAAELLAAQQRRLEALSKGMPVVVFRWVGKPDQFKRIEYVGGPLEELVGIDVETFERTGLDTVLRPADSERRYASMRDSVAQRTLFDFEAALIWTEEPRRWIRVQSSFNGMDGDDLIYDGVLTDVTQLRAHREEAERATQAKSAFLASMSHEIRTPLNGVIGAATLLAGSSLTEEQRELVEMQREAGAALLTVINDILDLSKIEAGKLELDPHPVDLERLLRRTVALVRPQAERKGLALEVEFPKGVHRGVMGDAARLRQVLLNLVTNAVKFTTSGEVRVEIAELAADADRRSLRVSVSDTGIGIPPEVRERLFLPFAQAEVGTTRQYGGTGLGLAICRELVTLMGGRIGVESTVGTGSTFWFELTLDRIRRVGSDDRSPVLSAGREAEAAIERAQQSARGLHVLVAEDVKINQVIAMKVLENAGHRVTVVGDGIQAVEAVSQGNFDLVLMDVRMPELDGLDATRRIRALGDERSRIPIIGLTAEAIQEELAKCIACGMDDTVTKPFDREVLLAKVEARAGLRLP